jgi:HEAT repeat protein
VRLLWQECQPSGVHAARLRRDDIAAGLIAFPGDARLGSKSRAGEVTMLDEDFRSAIESLRSTRVEEIERAIDHLREHLGTLPEEQFRAAVEAMSSLFFVDTYDRPDLESALDRVVEALASAGQKVVHLLLEFMRGSDIKSHLYLATTIGLIGNPALPALRLFVATEEDPYSRSCALFALGKIRDPEVRQALPEMVGSLMHPDKEVRDSAARALGKVVETVPADLLTERRRTEIFEVLFRALADPQPVVRSKCIRSLGKMVRAAYLTTAQEGQVDHAARSILGEDDLHEWDRAYIVRCEATEALRHLEARRR